MRLSARIKQILLSRPDPLAVLASTARVLSRATQVRIDLERLDHAAAELIRLQSSPPLWNREYHFWDGGPRSVHYIFLLDALNFSFWGEPRWSYQFHSSRLNGYWALAAALKLTSERDPTFLDPATWADLSPRTLARALQGEHEIPMFTDRWRNAREMGRVLCQHWGGDARNMVAAAAGDAPRLAGLVADNFSSFVDQGVYAGAPVFFLKRAQILVGDLYGQFEGKHWGSFDNIEALTAFADYKLPQILRAWGILRYAPALARRVNSRQEVPRDSPAELEIRAATIWSVELLRAALADLGQSMMSIELDWVIWQASQSGLPDGRPYHRTRTVYY